MSLHYHRNSDSFIAAAKYKALQAIRLNSPKGLTQLETAFYNANHPLKRTPAHRSSNQIVAFRTKDSSR